jgi:superfamily II DNA or RNA helicase
MSYAEFIESKKRVAKPMGFIPSWPLNANLFDWQDRIVHWCLRRGRCALFADTGLGKTLMQLEWARCVHEATGGPVIVHSPVGVRHQTKRESEKFGIKCQVEVVDTNAEVINGINLVNYEKMHLFDLSRFAGVVLDESSVLKNFTGKVKRQIVEAYRATPFRLACTATPAPNDHMELGNHADFLGVMPSNEMLSRWFINDTMKAGGYRLKGHGVEKFWEWVSSWAMCVSKPSDIGGDDTGYNLPKLSVHRHIVSVDFTPSADGLLFDVHGINATNIHEEKRRTNEARAQKVAELASQFAGESVLIWCNTNYEADELSDLLDYAAEVRGSDSESSKEASLRGFSDGSIRVLITKPEIAGMGMNFQVCSKMIFAGIGFSFEAYYQAVRRCWRFGQTKPVEVHLVISDAESAIEKTIARKEADHVLMQTGMANAMSVANLDANEAEMTRDKYQPTKRMELPKWITR